MTKFKVLFIVVWSIIALISCTDMVFCIIGWAGVLKPALIFLLSISTLKALTDD